MGQLFDKQILDEILIATAGLMGAAGIVLAALGAHGKPQAGLDNAGYLLLIHGLAVVAVVLGLRDGIIPRPEGIIAASGLVLGACLFAGAVSFRAYLHLPLFPFAAPIGGVILIVSWLFLAAAVLGAFR